MLRPKPLVEKAYNAHKQMLGMKHPTTALDLNNLAEIDRHSGQYEDVERKYKYALEILGKSFGLEHLYVGLVFNNLAEFYASVGRETEAIKLFNYSLEIYKTHYGLNHVKVAMILCNLADIYYMKLDDLLHALTIYKHSLKILENQQGPRHDKVVDIMYNLGRISHDLEHYEEAESYYKVVLKIYEETIGLKHNSVADLLFNFTSLYETQNKYSQAIPLYEYSLEILKEHSVENDPKMAVSYLKMAYTHSNNSDLKKAYSYFEKANNIISHCLKNDQLEFVEEHVINDNVIIPNSYLDQSLLSYYLSQEFPEDEDEYKNDSFKCSQMAQQIDQLNGLKQVGAFYDGEDTLLAEYVADKLVLTTKWNGNYQNLKETLSKPLDQQDKMAEATQRKLIENIDENLLQINKSLSEGFHDYVDLLTPHCINIDEIQSVLRKDEALVHFSFTANEGIVWVLTHDEADWIKLSIGEDQIREKVEKLRYGLDHTLWQTMGEAKRGQDILSVDYNWGNYSQGQPLPFDLSIAHELYMNLFEDIEKFIKDSDLIVITPPSLARLPLSVLVTDDKKTGTPTKYSDYRKVSWFGLKHSISLLPSVTAMRAIRSTLEISEPKKRFLGICHGYDPNSQSNIPKEDKEASKDQSKPQDNQKKSPFSKVANFSRGVLIDTNILRYDVPESDSIIEFQNLVSCFDNDEISVLFGKEATVEHIKEIENNGQLREYGIIHFAGSVVMNPKGIDKFQPTIELSPVKTEEQLSSNHYLGASDIVHFHLSANWVLLPASHKLQQKEDNLSGIHNLARAFFFSGAQTLLITHWAVNAEASSKILKEIFNLYENDTDLSRAKCMREAISNIIQDKSRPWNCHPSTWGAFSIIGESSAS